MVERTFKFKLLKESVVAKGLTCLSSAECFPQFLLIYFGYTLPLKQSNYIPDKLLSLRNKNYITEY
jgi:hypothetical protein